VILSFSRHIISIGFYPPLGDNTNKAGLSPALLKAHRNNMGH